MMTFMFLKYSLPKLPVPRLKMTLEKYLTLLSPILCRTDMQVTEQLVRNMLEPGGSGEMLQSHLLTRREKLDNWVSEKNF